jgi:hypothetical protein
MIKVTTEIKLTMMKNKNIKTKKKREITPELKGHLGTVRKQISFKRQRGPSSGRNRVS